MGRPIVPAYPTDVTGWTKHLAATVKADPPTSQAVTRRYSASTSSAVQSVPSSPTQPVTRRVSVASASVDHALPAFITVILDVKSLRIKVRRSAASESVFFTEWPRSTQEALPAVVAYDVGGIHWGFDAASHPERIENLRGLIESDSANVQLAVEGKSASQVFGEFLECVFKHVSAIKSLRRDLCRYVFVIPTHWDECEMGTYAKAVKFAVNKPEAVSFIRTIEAGAMGLIRNLRLGSQRTGVVLIDSEEPPHIITRTDYTASDDSNSLKQLPGSTVYDDNWNGILGAMENLEVESEGRTVIAMQGPQAALARILMGSRGKGALREVGPPNIIHITSDQAAQSADESLSISGPEPPSVERRLSKSYGVLSRVPFNAAVHDPGYIVSDYDDKSWCNNVVRWMAYKDESMQELTLSPRRARLQRELQPTSRPSEYLYACAAEPDSVRIGTWYKDTPGVTELRCMPDPDFSLLPSTEVTGEKARVRQVIFNLSLTFNPNLGLEFKLESLDGNTVKQVEATYETY